MRALIIHPERGADFGTRLARETEGRRGGGGGRGDWRRDEMRICRCQLLTLEKFPDSHGAQRGLSNEIDSRDLPRNLQLCPIAVDCLPLIREKNESKSIVGSHRVHCSASGTERNRNNK